MPGSSSAPNRSTLDGNPQLGITQGYRPTLADGGAILVDDTENPPDPETMPVSFAWNYFSAMLASVGRMIAVANFGLTAGVSPVFPFWQTGANLIENNPFSVYSRVGAGHYQIQWVSGTFPLIGAPKGYLNCTGGAHSYCITCQYMAAPPAGKAAVEVWTTTDGALADLPFQIDLY